MKAAAALLAFHCVGRKGLPAAADHLAGVLPLARTISPPWQCSRRSRNGMQCCTSATMPAEGHAATP